jgi:hypothetical protein
VGGLHRGKKILFVCGSLNQTTQMHQISKHLSDDYECLFTPFYCDGIYRTFQKFGWLDFTIIGGQNREKTERYFRENQLKVDYAGGAQKYDLALTCTDLLVPKNLLSQPLVLVQEGMTDPENVFYHIARKLHPFGIPRWLGSTATTGLSDEYDKFCVASDGYKDLFIRKGVKPEKIAVTGIPNFDNCAEYLKNDFPHKGYVLVATTDTRENLKPDNRKKFIKRCVELAKGRQIIFKLHPNEDAVRGRREAQKWAPGSLVFESGNTNHMVANCDVLITQYSSVVYVGLSLGKEVHSYFNLEELKRLCPVQNGGASASHIAKECRQYL